MAFCCCGDNFWYLSNSYPIYGYIQSKFEPPCCFSRAGSGCYPPCNGDGTAGPDWVPKDSCGIRNQIKYYEIKRDHSDRYAFPSEMWTAPWSPYTKAYNEGLITPEKLDTVWTINVDVNSWWPNNGDNVQNVVDAEWAFWFDSSISYTYVGCRPNTNLTIKNREKYGPNYYNRCTKPCNEVSKDDGCGCSVLCDGGEGIEEQLPSEAWCPSKVCRSAVCATLPQCCTGKWDSACAEAALQNTACADLAYSPFTILGVIEPPNLTVASFNPGYTTNIGFEFSALTENFRTEHVPTLYKKCKNICENFKMQYNGIDECHDYVYTMNTWPRELTEMTTNDPGKWSTINPPIINWELTQTDYPNWKDWASNSTEKNEFGLRYDYLTCNAPLLCPQTKCSDNNKKLGVCEQCRVTPSGIFKVPTQGEDIYNSGDIEVLHTIGPSADMPRSVSAASSAGTGVDGIFQFGNFISSILDLMDPFDTGYRVPDDNPGCCKDYNLRSFRFMQLLFTDVEDYHDPVWDGHGTDIYIKTNKIDSCGNNTCECQNPPCSECNCDTCGSCGQCPGCPSCDSETCGGGPIDTCDDCSCSNCSVCEENAGCPSCNSAECNGGGGCFPVECSFRLMGVQGGIELEEKLVELNNNIEIYNYNSLNPNDKENSIINLLSILENNNLSPSLVGGIALNIHKNYKLNTNTNIFMDIKDVDIVIEDIIDSDTMTKFLNILPKEWYYNMDYINSVFERTSSDDLGVVKTEIPIIIINTNNGIVVDIFRKYSQTAMGGFDFEKIKYKNNEISISTISSCILGRFYAMTNYKNRKNLKYIENTVSFIVTFIDQLNMGDIFTKLEYISRPNDINEYKNMFNKAFRIVQSSQNKEV